MKNTRKGFTLVELLVVIAILAILATVSVVGYTSFINRANDSNAATELHQIKSYIEADLMADNKWEFKGTDNVDYVITSIGGKLSASNGDLAAAIAKCPDLQGLGAFVVDGDDLKYTASNGKGEAVWADILYTCAHATTETVTGYAATCTENGLTNGVKCKECGYFTEEQTVIPAAHTNVVTDAAVSATCVATGKTEGSHCEACGVTIVAQTTTSMIAHTFNNKNICTCGATRLYLIPSTGWKEDNSSYAAWVWNDDGSVESKAIIGTDADGDGVYEFIVPAGYNEMKFVDLKPGKTDIGEWSESVRDERPTTDAAISTTGVVYYSVDMNKWYNNVPSILYFNPAHWNTGNAWFAAYFFGNGDTYVKMEDTDKDGIYACEMPTVAYTQVIFYRMDPAKPALTWESKWNQSGDLTLPTDGRNLWSPAAGKWDGDLGSWSTK